MLETQPNKRLLLSHPLHFIALGFGSGLAPRAPGTFGSLAGLLLYWPLHWLLSAPVFAGLVIVMFVIGVIAAGKTGREIGVSDHGAIVIDEIVALWALLLLLPQALAWQLLGFIVFRFFDITKPPPIGWLDRRLKGGFGVMVDDLLAAVYALLLLYGLSYLIGGV